jgi:hypothetical protein
MGTDDLAAILLACNRDADRALIENADYLALLGFRRDRCTAQELWKHLYAECAADPLLSEVNRAAIETILARGPLARRIMRALGAGFDRPRLDAVYRELCNCLADGRLFMGPDT